MTAAQALGRTRARDAVPALATVVDDPNEVVACAAIAAIEEINSDDNSPGAGKKSLN
jgi:HEAT repeat protein